jgi:hypothetical protein
MLKSATKMLKEIKTYIGKTKNDARRKNNKKLSFQVVRRKEDD